MKLQAVLLLLATVATISWANAAPIERLEDIPEFAKYKDILLKARHVRSKREVGEVGEMHPDVEAVPTCVSAAASGCLQTFASAAGLPFPLPKSAMIYNTLALALYQKNNGFLTFCRAYSALQSCLGANFAGCMLNPINLMKNLGVDAGNSIAYTSIFGGQQWSCGPGFQIYINNGQCINSVTTAQNATLQTCQNGLIANIQRNPNKVCSYYQLYLGCYSIPFRRGCGTPPAYAICETLRTGFMAATPGCAQLVCPTVNE